MAGSSHPNRGKRRSAYANPTPQEIRSVRAAIGVTLGQAAYMLRVTPEVYAEYEAGTKRMHPGLFRLLRFEAGLLAPHGGD